MRERERQSACVSEKVTACLCVGACKCVFGVSACVLRDKKKDKFALGHVQKRRLNWFFAYLIVRDTHFETAKG